jgi:acetyl esterase
MLRRLLAVAILIAFVCPALARQMKPNYPPKMDGSTVEVYKTVGDVKLNLYIFAPEGHQTTNKTPAIVFFFGGGWSTGSAEHFYEHCKYLASRGMVAVAADYRVSSRHGTKAVKCVSDGKSAVRWIRTHSERLGIDANQIAAGGGSAGGHVAACTGTISEFDEEKENADVSSMPNAMVLFNPVTMLDSDNAGRAGKRFRGKDMKNRAGVEPKALSPYHHIKKGVPPTILFHGRADTVVPYATAELFAEAMTNAGNECTLHGYKGRNHGFFNSPQFRSDATDYGDTVRKMDEFLVKHGFLTGEPTIK